MSGSGDIHEKCGRRAQYRRRTSEHECSHLTSFILAALNDGVKMLRTRFHVSSLRNSRQSDMGLLAITTFCTHTHTRAHRLVVTTVIEER